MCLRVHLYVGERVKEISMHRILTSTVVVSWRQEIWQHGRWRERREESERRLTVEVDEHKHENICVYVRYLVGEGNDLA